MCVCVCVWLAHSFGLDALEALRWKESLMQLLYSQLLHFVLRRVHAQQEQLEMQDGGAEVQQEAGEEERSLSLLDMPGWQDCFRCVR